MPTMYRSTLASLLAVLLAVTPLVPVTPATAAEPAGGRGIQVWNLNTHKMHRGDTDYTKFLDYVTDTSNPGVDHWPDIITLQEVQSEGSKRCSTFVKALERRTGRHDYACVRTGKQGGAAIVYRHGDDGFVAKKKHRRVVKLRINKERDGKGCVPTSGDGYRALVQRFVPRKGGARVNVASVHLPVNNNGDAIDCTWRNSRIVSRAVTRLGGGMSMMAGDWNQADRTSPRRSAPWTCWYKGVNKALHSDRCRGLGWTDAVCGKNRDCARKSWTTHNRRKDERKRIDFLFTKRARTTNAVTVAWNAASKDVHYSDHRGHGAVLHAR